MFRLLELMIMYLHRLPLVRDIIPRRSPDSGANIDAVNVPYIVVNDQDKYFDAIATGIQPLSISAVVCGGKLAYGCVRAPAKPLRVPFDGLYTF